MKKSKKILLFSYSLIFALAVVLAIDLAGMFSYSDAPFVIAFMLYGLFVVIQKVSSKMTFFIAVILLFYMGLSYIPTGSSVATERFGEWFFLSFAFGLAQYIKESWSERR
jgi:hypothetical protein